MSERSARFAGAASHPLQANHTSDNAASSGIAALFIALFLSAGAYNIFTSILGRPPRLQHIYDLVVSLTPASIIHMADTWLLQGAAPASPPITHDQKRERMGAILGTLGADNVLMALRPVTQTFSSPGSFLQRSSFLGDLDKQPPGLGNFDNSCYQNSILQGLASLDHLAPYLATSLENHDDPESAQAAVELRGLMERLRDTANNGKTLWTPNILKNMSSMIQQDAQEYFSKLLDEVDSAITKAKATASKEPAIDWVDLNEDGSSERSDDSGYHSSFVTAASKLSAASKATQAPQNPLEGLVGQRVACVQCEYTEGISLIPFNCLTLSLGVDGRDHDLYERLDAYATLEAIEGVACPRCTLRKLHHLLTVLKDRTPPENVMNKIIPRLEIVGKALEEEDFSDKTMTDCGVTPQSRVNVTKTKQVVIARPPKSLVVHMNRSVFDERTGQMFKNMAAVHFPMLLDLGPWCLGSAKKPSEKPGSGSGSDSGSPSGSDIEDEEKWSTGATSSMAAGSNKTSFISGPMYELRAVVTHYGHHHNGHYVCYRKHCPASAGPSNGQLEQNGNAVDDQASGQQTDEVDAEKTWWRISDESVRQVDEEVVMQEGSVFMLFYDCVDPTPLLTSDLEEETLAGSASVSDCMSALSDHATLVPEQVPLPDDTDDDLDEYESVFDEQREETPMTPVGSPMGEDDVIIPAQAEEDAEKPPVDHSPKDTARGKENRPPTSAPDAVGDTTKQDSASSTVGPLDSENNTVRPHLHGSQLLNSL